MIYKRVFLCWCLSLAMGVCAYAQEFESVDFLNDSYWELNTDALSALRARDRALYGYWAELIDIHKNVRHVLFDYKEGIGSRDEAQTTLISLLRRYLEIKEDPDFRVRSKTDKMLEDVVSTPRRRKLIRKESPEER